MWDTLQKTSRLHMERLDNYCLNSTRKIVITTTYLTGNYLATQIMFQVKILNINIHNTVGITDWSSHVQSTGAVAVWHRKSPGILTSHLHEHFKTAQQQQRLLLLDLGGNISQVKWVHAMVCSTPKQTYPICLSYLNNSAMATVTVATFLIQFGISVFMSLFW